MPVCEVNAEEDAPPGVTVLDVSLGRMPVSLAHGLCGLIQDAHTSFLKFRAGFGIAKGQPDRLVSGYDFNGRHELSPSLPPSLPPM